MLFCRVDGVLVSLLSRRVARGLAGLIGVPAVAWLCGAEVSLLFGPSACLMGKRLSRRVSAAPFELYGVHGQKEADPSVLLAAS